MLKRAYDSADKAARRRLILRVAGEMFMGGTGDLPAVADVAAAAGLAKGTVYLYFQTKGAIFTAILLEGWQAVFEEVELAFGGEAAGRDEKVAAFVARFVAYIERNPQLLRLDSLGHGVIERNLDHDALIAFKQALLDGLIVASATVERALGLTPGRGLSLLTRTYAMTRGLWQASGAGDAAAGIPTAFSNGFAAELTEALTEYWRGALACRSTADARHLPG